MMTHNNKNNDEQGWTISSLLQYYNKSHRYRLTELGQMLYYMFQRSEHTDIIVCRMGKCIKFKMYLCCFKTVEVILNFF